MASPKALSTVVESSVETVKYLQIGMYSAAAKAAVDD